MNMEMMEINEADMNQLRHGSTHANAPTLEDVLKEWVCFYCDITMKKFPPEWMVHEKVLSLWVEFCPECGCRMTVCSNSINNFL